MNPTGPDDALSARYMYWDLQGSATGRTILIFDDKWFEPHLAVRENIDYRDSDACDKVKQYYRKKTSTDADDPTIPLLIIELMKLEDVRRIILADLPVPDEEEGEGEREKEKERKRKRERERMEAAINRVLQIGDLNLEQAHFIIDLNYGRLKGYSATRRYVGEPLIRHLVEQHRVPPYHILVFTGGDDVALKTPLADRLPNFIVANKGLFLGREPATIAAMARWWDSATGKISYREFGEKTKGKLWHNVSNLNILLGLDEEALKTELYEIVSYDIYQVWSWVVETLLNQEHKLIRKQYDFACGKVFLKYGAAQPWWPIGCLRALIYSVVQLVGVEGEIKLPQADDIPAQFQNQPDDEMFGYIRCGVPGSEFWQVASAFRDWMRSLSTNQAIAGEDRIKIRTIELIPSIQGSHSIKVQFDNRMPRAAFGKPSGNVTRNWAALVDCFKEPASCTYSDNRDSVTLQFAPCEEDKETHA